MKIIQTVLESDVFADKPPVLIDIGASGEINKKWKSIAKYCVCLAFDADDREFSIKEESKSSFRKLIKINRIVSAVATQEASFYLTKSPFCSSLLEPETSALEPWIFRDLFTLENIVTLKSITIAEALNQSELSYVDWFKSDTQGTDLRLFSNLPDEVKQGVLAVEVEPGIIDAYRGEDKLYSVMQEVAKQGFWLSSMIVKGVQRIKPIYAETLGSYVTERSIRSSPGWAEVTYLRLPVLEKERDYLLLFIFSLMERQYGYAIEVLDAAMVKFPSPLMTECRRAVLAQLKKNKLSVPLVILKRQMLKIFSRIHE